MDFNSAYLTPGVFSTAVFYFLIIGGPLLLNSYGLLFSQTLNFFLKTCGLLFSVPAEFIWTMEFFIAYRQCFLTVDFYFLKIGGPLLLNSCGLLFSHLP